MNFIQNLFGGGAANLVDSLGNAIDKVSTTKEEKLQLELEERKAERAYQLESQRLQLDEKKAYLQDTASARDMNSRVQETVNASWLSKNITPLLAGVTVFLAFVLFYIFAFKTVDVASKDIVIYILGVLSAIVSQIFSFYYGSSIGSQDKSDQIKKIMEK